jgi:hypothetical protein
MGWRRRRALGQVRRQRRRSELEKIGVFGKAGASEGNRMARAKSN